MNNRIKLFYMLIIFCLSLLLGIGYAQISDITLDVSGTTALVGQSNIFISNVSYDSNVNANTQNSKINTYYQTNLDSTIVLGQTANSSITYQITIMNTSSVDVVYDQIIYDNNFYDNTDIVIIENGISHGDILNAGNSITFSITFQYINNLGNITNDTLNSYINFRFAPSYVVDRYYYYIDETDNRVTAKQNTSENVLADTTINIASTPMNLDYYDLKYFVNNNEYNNNTYTVNSNTLVDEVYYLNRYSITYNLDGGTVNSNPTIYTAMSGTITLNNPIKDGFTFLGWTWDGQTTPVLNMSFAASDKENKKFTANWQSAGYLLAPGNRINNLTDSKVKVIFGKSSDYTNIVDSITPVLVGATSSDLIYSYTSGNTVYILADAVIKFNPDSSQMFNGHDSLTQVTFDNIDTSSVTNMNNMFRYCNALVTIDLSKFNTSALVYANKMFEQYSTGKLKTIYVSDGWDMSHVTYSNYMFRNATKIVGGNGTTYDSNKINKEYARVDASGTPGYLTYKAN